MIIIILLILIVLILLFGAGVVQGWLANILGVGCGLVLLIAIILFAGSFFGKDGPTYVIYGIVGLLGSLGIWAAITGEGTKR